MYILILACDLTKDGMALGPHTIARLEAAVRYSETIQNSCFVTAAVHSPDFPNQLLAVSTLMANWLRERKHECIDLQGYATFNTRGELEKFFELRAYERVIVSSWWHIPRVKRIARQLQGKNKINSSIDLRKVTYVKAKDRFTVRLFLLEGIKWCKVFTPEPLRDPVEKMYRRFIGRSYY